MVSYYIMSYCVLYKLPLVLKIMELEVMIGVKVLPSEAEWLKRSQGISYQVVKVCKICSAKKRME